MTSRETMVLHVEALFRHDAAGRLTSVNEPAGGPAPRFFVGYTSDGPVCRARADVPDARRRELEAIAHDRSPGDGRWARPIDPGEFRRCLDRGSAIETIHRIWTGPAYEVPASATAVGDVLCVTMEDVEVLEPHFADWIPDVAAGAPLAATLLDGVAVSVCCSVRRTSSAHEAGVETVAALRGRGLAPAAVAAWAREVRSRGLMPLYSTSWDNGASLSVARKLGLAQFGSDLHIT